jgi:hypothetical protein
MVPSNPTRIQIVSQSSVPRMNAAEEIHKEICEGWLRSDLLVTNPSPKTCESIRKISRTLDQGGAICWLYDSVFSP